MASVVPHSNHRDEDFLVGMAHRNPIGTLRFVRSAMVAGSVSSAVVCVATVFVLSFYWDCCQRCERPLGWWLLIHCMMQLVMLAMRFCFLHKLQVAGAPGMDIQRCVETLASMQAWHVSKMMSLVTYGWMTLGAVWLVNSGECSSHCPALYMMTMAAILHAGIRVALVHMCFTTHCSPGAAVPEAPKVSGASIEEVIALPTLRFSAKRTTDPDHASCAVCLCDYCDGDLLRRLPCGHHFHQRCADKWLRRNKRCPLCMAAIDEVKPQLGMQRCLRRKKIQ